MTTTTQKADTLSSQLADFAAAHSEHQSQIDTYRQLQRVIEVVLKVVGGNNELVVCLEGSLANGTALRGGSSDADYVLRNQGPLTITKRVRNHFVRVLRKVLARLPHFTALTLTVKKKAVTGHCEVWNGTEAAGDFEELCAGDNDDRAAEQCMQQLSGSGVSYAAAAFAAAAVSSQEEVLEDLASAEDGSSFKMHFELMSRPEEALPSQFPVARYSFDVVFERATFGKPVSPAPDDLTPLSPTEMAAIKLLKYMKRQVGGFKGVEGFKFEGVVRSRHKRLQDKLGQTPNLLQTLAASLLAFPDPNSSDLGKLLCSLRADVEAEVCVPFGDLCDQGQYWCLSATCTFVLRALAHFLVIPWSGQSPLTHQHLEAIFSRNISQSDESLTPESKPTSLLEISSRAPEMLRSCEQQDSEQAEWSDPIDLLMQIGSHKSPLTLSPSHRPCHRAPKNPDALSSPPSGGEASSSGAVADADAEDQNEVIVLQPALSAPSATPTPPSSAAPPAETSRGPRREPVAAAQVTPPLAIHGRQQQQERAGASSQQRAQRAPPTRHEQQQGSQQQQMQPQSDQGQQTQQQGSQQQQTQPQQQQQTQAPSPDTYSDPSWLHQLKRLCNDRRWVLHVADASLPSDPQGFKVSTTVYFLVPFLGMWAQHMIHMVSAHAPTKEEAELQSQWCMWKLIFCDDDECGGDQPMPLLPGQTPSMIPQVHQQQQRDERSQHQPQEQPDQEQQLPQQQQQNPPPLTPQPAHSAASSSSSPPAAHETPQHSSESTSSASPSTPTTATISVPEGGQAHFPTPTSLMLGPALEGMPNVVQQLRSAHAIHSNPAQPVGLLNEHCFKYPGAKATYSEVDTQGVQQPPAQFAVESSITKTVAPDSEAVIHGPVVGWGQSKRVAKAAAASMLLYLMLQQQQQGQSNVPQLPAL